MTEKKKAPTPRQKSQGRGSSEMLVQQCLECELVEKKKLSPTFFLLWVLTKVTFG